MQIHLAINSPSQVVRVTLPFHGQGGEISSKGILGTWLAQLVEHMTLDHRVASLGPTLGTELTFKIFVESKSK